MKTFSWIKLITLFFLVMFPASSSIAQALNCNSPYKSQTLNTDKLRFILSHRQTLPLNLCGTTLTYADLKNANLDNIDLSGADISHSNLQSASLSRANLFLTFFRWSNLSNSNLERANLEKAILSDSTLNDANLQYANLKYANLGDADLRGANLSFANLEGANLTNANLQGADLRFANLKNADLSNANLQDASLVGAFLISANLQQTILKNTDLTDADLKNAIYEPKLHTLPNLISFLSVKNFRTINFQNSNASRAVLTELRNAYTAVGIRSMEHFITSTIKYHEMLDGWKNGGWRSVESTLGYLFFYLTSDYGSDPVRPIKILLVSIFIFAIPYRVALSIMNKQAGIVAVWLPKRFYHWNRAKKVSSMPFFLSKLLGHHFVAREPHWIEKQIRLLSLSLFFSLLSTFSIGWKEINVGNWILHLQAREYMLKGKGWVRAVAGFQSLLSAYLIVLWLICYFGKPFEW